MPTPQPDQRAVTFTPGDPGAIEQFKIATMADAMELAMSRAHSVDDGDPDPYGFAQELEDEFGVDLLQPEWKAAPTDPRWEKRTKARARKALVARYFLAGDTIPIIAGRMRISTATIYKDLALISQEWRKSYLGDVEVLAGQALAQLDHLYQKLSPAIDRGDTKAVAAALDIIKERGQILGYRSGIQIDVEQYIREVAEANGFDPKRAVEIANRVSVTMH